MSFNNNIKYNQSVYYNKIFVFIFFFFKLSQNNMKYSKVDKFKKQMNFEEPIEEFFS